MIKMRFLLLSSALSVLAVAIVWHAYTLKQQFYPTVVFLTRSNRTMAVLYAEALVIVIALGRLLSKIFFGRLRYAEVEHLRERLWYAVTEGCLIFAVLRDDIGVRFVGLLGLLLFLKCFHWLMEERTDYMEQSTAINKLFHVRMLSLFALLTMCDTTMLGYSARNVLQRNSLMQLVFAFEYAILLLTLLGTLVRYILHTIDKRYETAWDAKNSYLLYSDLLLSGIRVALYALFIFVMSSMRTLPLFCIRQAYLSVRAFRKALSDIVLSRRAIRNMNTLYPSPTIEELRAGDATCIICREDMLLSAQNVAGGVQGCKKLPCGHVFHVACLRSWFQRQQSCPTCRLDVIRNAPAPTNAPNAAANGQPPIVNNLNANLNRNPNVAPPAANEQLHNAPNAPRNADALPNGLPPFPFPPFAFPPNFNMPSPSAFPVPPIPPIPFGAIPPPVFCICPPFPPPSTPNLVGLSEAELREMESNERAGLQARIECLRNVQTLLDAAMMQFSQYNAAVRSAPQATSTSFATSNDQRSAS